MIAVSFIYPDREGAHFDEAYYTQKHLPRVRELWEPLGLESVTPFVRVDDSQDSGPFRALSLLYFASLEQYRNALENGGSELINDIRNFTDIEPIAQISKQI